MTHNRAAPPVTQGEGEMAVDGGVGVGKGDVTGGESRAEELVRSGCAPRSHRAAAAPSTTSSASASHRRGG
jgi:hypothetical protein